MCTTGEQQAKWMPQKRETWTDYWLMIVLFDFFVYLFARVFCALCLSVYSVCEMFERVLASSFVRLHALQMNLLSDNSIQSS